MTTTPEIEPCPREGCDAQPRLHRSLGRSWVECAGRATSACWSGPMEASDAEAVAEWNDVSRRARANREEPTR